MDEKRTASPFITLILVLTVLCILATSLFTFGVTRTPQDYAEATMIAAATATALPFKATEMAEGLRHQQTVNATQEQVYKTLMQGLNVFATSLQGRTILMRGDRRKSHRRYPAR